MKKFVLTASPVFGAVQVELGCMLCELGWMLYESSKVISSTSQLNAACHLFSRKAEEGKVGCTMLPVYAEHVTKSPVALERSSPTWL